MTVIPGFRHRAMRVVVKMLSRSFFILIFSACLGAAPAVAQPRGAGYPPPGGERHGGMRYPYNGFDNPQNTFPSRNEGFDGRRQRLSPEERREKAEQLRVIPEKKPKADKESARSGTKRQQEVYATIDKSYEDMKDSKRVTEDSALVSLRYTARNMVETCDVLFTNFPGLLEKPDYKDQVIEIMQEPKQYILKLEGETDNEQH